MYTTLSNIRIRTNKQRNNVNKKRLKNIKRGQLLSSYHGALSNYIHGLLHPELAVTTSNIPKCPNYVSIPTSNITFREAFDIDPDKNGEFILYWTPNFLSTNEAIKFKSQNWATDYSRNWLGGFDDTHQEFGYYPISAYQPPASFNKYRLVSAGCKITYKGPVIERAGIISHCLSYRSLPMVFFKENDSDFLSQTAFNTIMDPAHFGKDLQNLDVTAIQNGMWNGVQNVQKNQTVFVVSVPTDPSDFIFEDDGFFYASASADAKVPVRSANWTDGAGNICTYGFCPQLSQDGTPVSYIFKGTDLTKNAKLYVEQFYNFEVIPTEESAPILRPKKTELNSSQLDLAKDIVTQSLDKVKGDVRNINSKMIDNLIKADSQNADNQLFGSNFSINADDLISEVKKSVKQAVNKNNQDLWTQMKNNAKQQTKNNVNFVKNKVLTKDNLKFAVELLGAFLNKKGK